MSILENNFDTRGIMTMTWGWSQNVAKNESFHLPEPPILNADMTPESFLWWITSENISHIQDTNACFSAMKISCGYLYCEWCYKGSKMLENNEVNKLNALWGTVTHKIPIVWMNYSSSLAWLHWICKRYVEKIEDRQSQKIYTEKNPSSSEGVRRVEWPYTVVCLHLSRPVGGFSDLFPTPNDRGFWQKLSHLALTWCLPLKFSRVHPRSEWKNRAEHRTFVREKSQTISDAHHSRYVYINLVRETVVSSNVSISPRKS